MPKLKLIFIFLLFCFSLLAQQNSDSGVDFLDKVNDPEPAKTQESNTVTTENVEKTEKKTDEVHTVPKEKPRVKKKKISSSGAEAVKVPKKKTIEPTWLESQSDIHDQYLTGEKTPVVIRNESSGTDSEKEITNQSGDSTSQLSDNSILHYFDDLARYKKALIIVVLLIIFAIYRKNSGRGGNGGGSKRIPVPINRASNKYRK